MCIRDRGHDEGDRNRPCGDAAGVKGHGQEFFGDEECQDEHKDVQYQQKVVQGEFLLQGVHHGKDQEGPHACLLYTSR